MGISEPWVLLRGLMRHSGHWGAFGEKLQQEFPSSKILLLDLPGNGTKCQLSTPTNVNEIIDILREEVHRATGTTPFHFLGLSLGAMVGLKWAEGSPESFLSFIAINPSLKQYSKPWQRLRPQSLFGIAAAILAKDPLSREKIILHLTSAMSSDKQQHLAQLFADFDLQWPLKRDNFLRQIVLASRIQLKKPIKVPMAIFASAQDCLVSSRCSIDLARAFSSHIEVHPTAGHDLVLDDPNWVISQIKSFVFQLGQKT
jgi:pimeloyl-ACP methyl ester carboxylesterase